MSRFENLAKALAKKPSRAKRSENQKVFLAVFKDWDNAYWDTTHASTGLMTKATSAEALLHNLPQSEDKFSWGIILNANGFKSVTDAVAALKLYYETECGGVITLGEDSNWTLWRVVLE